MYMSQGLISITNSTIVSFTNQTYLCGDQRPSPLSTFVATINIAGGFYVTQRMLKMFRK